MTDIGYLFDFMSILKVLIILIEVVVLFNVIIIVHELGHFLAAKWRKLKIDRFGVWFGKPLWEKEYKGVHYSLGSIPAGGFVALPQLAPMEMIEGTDASGETEELPPISPLDKIIVAVAGPLFSLGLALFFAVVVWQIGRPISESETTTIIGYVQEGSPAAEVGILPGDRILEIDGSPVTKFGGMGDSVSWRIASSVGETISIKLDRAGEILTVNPKPIVPETKGWQRAQTRQIQIRPYQTPMVARILEDSPAQVAGLQPNDLIVKAGDQPILHRITLSDIIRENGEKPLELEVTRKGESIHLTMTPEIPTYPDSYPEEARGPMIGILWDNSGVMDLEYSGPWEQVKGSIDTLVSTLGALFSPESDIKAQHLSGPVGIMRIYYLLFESEQGWRLAIWFSVILNVNLAILNMLPIPVLDGGHITLAVLEAIRRKPLNIRILQFVQSGFAALLIGYMLYVTFFDVQDISWGRSSNASEGQTIQFSPKSEATNPASQ